MRHCVKLRADLSTQTAADIRPYLRFLKRAVVDHLGFFKIEISTADTVRRVTSPRQISSDRLVRCGGMAIFQCLPFPITSVTVLPRNGLKARIQLPAQH